MRRKLRATLVFVLFAAAASWDVRAQVPDAWGGLERGPHAVGFRFVYRLDHSRNWRATEDAEGYPRGGRRGRPVRVSVWYPARARAGAAPMLYRDYMPATAAGAEFAELNRLLQKRDAANLRASLGDAAFERLSATRTGASMGATPARGPFPLVVYSAGLNNSSEDNVVLCEYLASHGYVVAAVPQAGVTSLDVDLKFPSAPDLETQVLDLQFAVGALRDFAAADPTRLGVAGYSVGGVAALDFVLRGTDVDALVTLDPTFGVAPRVRLVTDAPHYAPARVRAPWLYVHRREPATSLAVFDALRHAPRYRLELAGVAHRDFSSLALFAPHAPAAGARTPETARRGYLLLCRRVLAFFDAHLKQDARALALVGRAPEDSGVVAAFETRGAVAPPPTEEKFLRVLEREGFARAVALYNEARARDAGRPVFGESFLNEVGYMLVNRNRLAEAVEVFKLNVEAYPASANVYDSLAEAYMRGGQRALAVKFYEKTLELNPNNPAAVENLKKLKSEGP